MTELSESAPSRGADNIRAPMLVYALTVLLVLKLEDEQGTTRCLTDLQSPVRLAVFHVQAGPNWTFSWPIFRRASERRWRPPSCLGPGSVALDHLGGYGEVRYSVVTFG